MDDKQFRRLHDMLSGEVPLSPKCLLSRVNQVEEQMQQSLENQRVMQEQLRPLVIQQRVQTWLLGIFASGFTVALMAKFVGWLFR